jgi:hypothetical protein
MRALDESDRMAFVQLKDGADDPCGRPLLRGTTSPLGVPTRIAPRNARGTCLKPDEERCRRGYREKRAFHPSASAAASLLA